MQSVLGRSFAVLILGAAMGCAEPPTASPNSDQGEFFVDNDLAVARGWQAYMHLAGPLTGKQHCDQATGVCYADHRAVEVVDIISEDAQVVDVLEFGEHTLGEVKGARVLLIGHEEGEVKLEAELKIGEETVTDTFDVRVAELHTVELARQLETVAPFSRYAGCTNEGAGAYVFDNIEGMEIRLWMLKKDSRGNLLGGHGQFPIDVVPEGAAEIVDDGEGQHLIRIQPKGLGDIALRSQKGGSSLQFRFVTEQAIDGAQAGAFRRDARGQRVEAVNQFVQGEIYDVALFPFVGQAPLCGGDARTKKEVRTPANCSFVGAAHPGSNQLIQATQPGECHLVFTMEGAGGGQGLQYDIVVDVIPGEYAGDPGW